MIEPFDAQRSAELLSALAAPERLRIVCFLKDGEKNVTQIADMLQTQPVNVSHHSSVLKHAGLLRSRKVGRFMYYAMTPGILTIHEDGKGVHLNLGSCSLDLTFEPAVQTETIMPNSTSIHSTTQHRPARIVVESGVGGPSNDLHTISAKSGEVPSTPR